MCVVGRTDLLGIARADRADTVGALDGGLHQIDAAVIFHERMLVFAKGEDVPKDGEIVFSLIFDVNGIFQARVLE